MCVTLVPSLWLPTSSFWFFNCVRWFLRAVDVRWIRLSSALAIEAEKGCLPICDMNTPRNFRAVAEDYLLDRISSIVEFKDAKPRSLAQNLSVVVLETFEPP